MTDGLRRRLLSALRVPPEPRLPAGEPGSARVFRAAGNFWKLKVLGWGIRQAATFAGFVFLMVMLQAAPETMPVNNARRAPRVALAAPIAFIRVFETVAWGLWLVQLPVTFAILRLDYELRWYIVTDRAARLREGILNLREMTFTLANVQDIRIRQGPLQRLLGLADVELRTAGGSEVPAGQAGHGASESRNLHLARFRGVGNAEAIRDLVIDRMKKARGAGLGDPDDALPPAPRSLPLDVEAAARELADESARLRAAAARLAQA
jgi:membrane protein YdbS with pleckstrin-like domain